ncbi:MAG: hypothetical protein CSA11_08610 [Chloroflexi bacterium]|nr:MAG: hypothetical protein CSA11_08610 [Chloroflexota bacterium]
MMTRILKTKLFVPPLRQEIVARPPLLARLDGVQQRPFALISAPAGFGKTTLVVEWINQMAAGRNKKAEMPPFSIAWLSLDENDNDPMRFWRYVVAALQTAVPNLPDDVTSILDEQVPVAVAGFLTDLLNALTTTTSRRPRDIPHPVTLVLDDYHLIEDDNIHKGIAFLLDHTPPHMHLIMTTRQDPPLPLARLRGRNLLVEIRQNDLAFSQAEAAQFLNEVMGLALHEEAISTLSARTEGWITGLQMAALSMQGQDDVDGFLAAFTGSHRYVLDYLMEEVWQRQPPEIQHFLRQTAVLDKLCAELCQKLITADEAFKQGTQTNPSSSIFHLNCQAILEHLDRTNLFIISLDEARFWYRYHHLFADLLRQRLAQTKPERIPVLHALAGEWYEENGRLPEAIHHYLQSMTQDRAAELIMQVADTYLMRSEIDILLNWIGSLSHETMGKYPLLFVYQAGAMLLAGQSFKTIEAYLQEALAYSNGKTTGEVNVLRSLIAAFQGQLEASTYYSEKALELLPPENLFLHSVVIQNMALAQMLNGDVNIAIDSLLTAAKVCAEANNVMSQVICLTHVAESSILAGRLFAAKDYYEQAIVLAVDGQKRPLPVMSNAKLGMGEIYREWNQLDKAAALSAEGLALFKRWSEISGLDGYVWSARIRQAQGDEAGALADMEKAKEIAARFDTWELGNYMVGILRAQLDIEQGRVETAVRWLNKSGIHEASLAETPYHMWETGHMTLIRLAIAQQEYEQALNLIAKILEQAAKMGRQGTVIDALTLQAIAYHHTHRPQEAQTALQQALTLAEPEQYIRIFLDKGTPIRQLLGTLQQTVQTPNLQPYITQLLTAFQSSTTNRRAATVSRQVPIVDPLSSRELEVLNLIATGYTNRHIAEQLFIAHSTVKTHINNIYNKLGVSNREAALTRAQELGLI